jgi:hypothetical protein
MSENVDLTVKAEPTPFVLNERNAVDGFVLNPDTSESVEFQLEQVTLTGSPSLVGPRGEPSIRGFSSFMGGKPLSNETIVCAVAPYDFTITASDCVAKCLVAADLDNTFTIFKNGVQIGVIHFASGATEGSFTFTDLNIVTGDVVTIVSPVIIDGDLANLTILIV